MILLDAGARAWQVSVAADAANDSGLTQGSWTVLTLAELRANAMDDSGPD